MIKQNRHDPYWLQVANQMKQFEGLVDGYNSANPTLPLTTMQLLLVQASGYVCAPAPLVIFAAITTAICTISFPPSCRRSVSTSAR